MKVSLFLGVPHAQVNAYIQKLAFHQIRITRGYNGPIPEIPTDLVLPEPERKPRQQNNEALAALEGKAPARRKHGNRSRSSKISASTHDSDYSSNPGEEGNGKAALEVQKASMWARTFGACMLEDLLGCSTVRKTEIGDPLSVKTYGWRMLHSEEIVDPYSAQDLRIARKKKGGLEVEVTYVPVADLDVDVAAEALKEGKKVGDRNPHCTLAYSAWWCPANAAEEELEKPRAAPFGPSAAVKDEGHQATTCTCRDKVKRIMVCAVLDNKEGEECILPLRIETFVWRPETVGEVRAFAEFARGLCE